MGWTDGRNVRIDYRLAEGDAERVRRHAADVIALVPDVVLANGTTALGPLLEVTRTVPIVFVQITDPVSTGYVESLARPGGNFWLLAVRIRNEPQVAGVAPADRARVTRAAVLRDSTQPTGIAIGGDVLRGPGFGD